MTIFFCIVVFVFGLCLGSFLNCLTCRLEKSEGLIPGRTKKKDSFLSGRSFCPKCKHKLGVWDLIPILSFFILKGRCRYCKKKISWQYPLVEIGTGFLLVFIFYFLMPSQFSLLNFRFLITALYLLLNSCLLIIVFLYDLKHYLIPDKIIYPAIGLVFLYRIINVETLLPAFLAGLAAAAFFFLIWLGSKGRWMGFGDVKLTFFLGLFLGWPNIAVALFLAFLSGSLVGIILISLGKKKLKSEVPFGPFLIAAAFLSLVWGQNLITWYLDLLS